MHKRTILYLDMIVFFISFLLFGAILFYIRTDIHLHAEYIQKVASGTLLPPANFMYYLIVYIFALFNTQTSSLLISSIFILSLSVTAKFIITRKIHLQYYKKTFEDNSASDTIIILNSVLLLIVFSLPTNRFYLGQIPPNIWHNSTTIFIMPFALSLFWLSYEQLVQPSTHKIILIAILCILNILIKPSFFFTFSLTYPLMLLIRFRLGRNLWLNLTPIIIGSILVIIMYYLIYQMSFGNRFTSNIGIAIRPFSVWSHYSSNIPLSLIFSLIFPIVYIGFYGKDLMKHMLLQYAVILYVISIGIFTLLSETGAREFHGNFFWQCPICSYILFLVTSILFTEKIKKIGKSNWKNITILVFFLSHVIAGILYLGKILYTKSII